jgi:arginine/serine-rich splicing factor 1/9
MSSQSGNMKSDSRIYIGNLPPDIRSKDLEDLFYKYGKIKFIDLKNRKGPPFAFIEYEDKRDAEDAIKARDGYNYEKYKLRVEFQKGSKNGSSSGGGGGGGGGSNSFGGSSGGAGGRNAPPRRSDYRIIVSGLPASGSWQDLKDHMREAGTVCYADVFKDGTGVVEFIHYDDMKYAVKNLDDTKFRSHEVF